MDYQEEFRNFLSSDRFDDALALYRRHGSGARYHVKDRDELKNIVDRCIAQNPECDLNWLDVSAVTDMHALFFCTPFNGDISDWDVSNVVDMDHMFRRSAFRGDISKWNLRNIDDIGHIYC